MVLPFRFFERGVDMEATSSRHSSLIWQFVLLLCLLILITGVFAAAAACRSTPASASASQVALRLVTDKKVGPAAVEVTIRSADGSPLGGAQVALRGDMNHAGMKPVMVQMREVSRGTYLADDFKFTMAGDWLLTVEAVLPGGEKVERTFDVPGVTNG